MADSRREEVESVPVIAVTAAVGAIVLIFVLLFGAKRKEDAKSKKQEKSVENDSGNKTSNRNKSKHSKHHQQQQPQQQDRKVSVKDTFSHPWLASSLKGHSQKILDLDFSINGKYLVTCSEDRTILIWTTKEFNQKEHKSLRANVELDHATRVKFSPDSKAFITALAMQDTIRIFKIGKKDDGSPGNITAMEQDFSKKIDADIINIGISCIGTFILSCHNDTTLIVWSIKGEELARVDTRQMHNNYGCVSPCGRFIASAGFTPDVKVWEVNFTKAGEFRDVSRAFELKGHNASVYSFCFNLDSTRMATVSKDATWKLWDTDIEYKKRQDPYLLQTGQYEQCNIPALIALSPDALTVAIATGTELYVIDTTNEIPVEHIQHVHTGAITGVAFSMSNKHLVTCGDRHVRVFHNFPGYQANITTLENKLKKATNEPLRDRLREQIKENRKMLNVIIGGSGDGTS